MKPTLGRRVGVALLVVAALVGTACGSRLPKDTLEAIDAGASRGASNGSGNGDLTGDDSSTAAGDSSTGAGTGAGTGGLGGGTGASNNGSSSGTNRNQTATTASAGASACASGTRTVSDVGVTPTEIHAASIVTDSGPLPGATEGSYRGAAAYFAMVNAQGGVCGRKLTLLKGDDGLDPAKGRAEFLRLEPKVLAFVGSFAVADSGYVEPDRADQRAVREPHRRPGRARTSRTCTRRTGGTTSTPDRSCGGASSIPNDKRAGFLYADIGGVAANVPGFGVAVKRAGFEVVHDEAVRVTDPDYTGIVRNLQNESVQFLYLFAFEVNMHVRFARNMRQQNFYPPIKGANIAFNTRFTELLGRDGDGWENHQTYLLFLDPAEKARSKPLADFIDWNAARVPRWPARPVPGQRLGLRRPVRRRAQVQGPNVTRKGLMEALYKVPKFDFGGINAAVNPATGEGDRCFMMAKVVSGQWKREWPSSGEYECNVGENYKFR